MLYLSNVKDVLQNEKSKLTWIYVVLSWQVQYFNVYIEDTITIS